MNHIDDQNKSTSLQTLSDEEIINAEFPEPASIIPGIHPEG